MKFTWMFIAFLSGAVLPIQAGLNTKLGKSIESPVFAALISFLVGTLTIGLYILFSKQTISIAGLKSAPMHVWLGGILGAFYVTALVTIFPKIGPALTFGLIVAGQMFIAILLDHFNILVDQQHSINIWRVLGMLLIVAGVILIRKF
ncbi:MAG TPA: DMT family transporter [Ferruginibacter sp.]|nr:DMT family transporter [Ferruginibacter sp.]HRE62493.1 DMT family transporter [Ferruginibacter sp.]